jgi:hypothetical protein
MGVVLACVAGAYYLGLGRHAVQGWRKGHEQPPALEGHETDEISERWGTPDPPLPTRTLRPAASLMGQAPAGPETAGAARPPDGAPAEGPVRMAPHAAAPAGVDPASDEPDGVGSGAQQARQEAEPATETPAGPLTGAFEGRGQRFSPVRLERASPGQEGERATGGEPW